MPSETFDVTPRIDALLTALDEAIAGAVKKSARRRKRKRQQQFPVARFSSPRNLSRVLFALSEKVRAATAAEPRSCGLGWYELRAASGLTDDQLGLALSDLMPAQVRCRDEGGGRIYFLPAATRTKLLRKREGGELGAQAA